MADAQPPGLAPDTLAAIQSAVHELPDACDRLRYVKEMTEKAANQVFALIDQLQADARQLQQLAEAPDATALRSLAERQQALGTALMMSQDFQDLSGQVINKVVKLLQSVEQPLEQVLAQAEPVAVAAAGDELTGVQTPDKALKQDDVDDLLASLGF